MLRLAVIVVVAAIFVGFALGVGIPVVLKFLNSLDQPRIILYNVRTLSYGCILANATAQFYRVEFQIWNAGDVDGFAKVATQRDGTLVANGTYFVGAHSGISTEEDFTINDCSTHTWAVVVVSSARA